MMARIDRYRNCSIMERARRQFGDVYIDLTVPPNGLDIETLEDWCVGSFGEKWRSWTHASHWKMSGDARRDYIRFFFVDLNMAETFRSFWLGQF